MAHDHRVPIAAVSFRKLTSIDGRTRTVFLTESRKGKGVKVETYGKEGQQLGGTIVLFPAELPAFLEALTAAAAAIGVETPAPSSVETGRAGLDRYLTRARGL